jgi:hypothetical protein
VTGALDGFTVRSPWLDEPIAGLTSVAAACCVVADLAECLLDVEPDLLCLHCGAAEIGGRLVALTGPSHMGKSTLAARLSMEDVVLYCDDMLPIDRDGNGIALGAGPRLRLPLPPSASPAFAAHVARHRGPSDGRYAYVNAPSVAAYGRRAPVGAVLLLDRRPGGPARLREAVRADALAFLVRQNIAADRLPDEILDRFDALLAGARCLRLEYADLDEAAALVTRSFARWPADDVPALPVAPEQETVPDASGQPPLPRGVRFARSAGIGVRQVGDDVFLAEAATRRIHRLNATGGILWSLLGDPKGADDLAEALRTLYPSVPAERIAGDVSALLAALWADGLIRVEARP